MQLLTHLVKSVFCLVMDSIYCEQVMVHRLAMGDLLPVDSVISYQGPVAVGYFLADKDNSMYSIKKEGA
jgi:hypothetical protein